MLDKALLIVMIVAGPATGTPDSNGRIAFVAGSEQDDLCLSVLDLATGEVR